MPTSCLFKGPPWVVHAQRVSKEHKLKMGREFVFIYCLQKVKKELTVLDQFLFFNIKKVNFLRNEVMHKFKKINFLLFLVLFLKCVFADNFTSRSIENALSSAKERGVKVQVILDKSILSNPGNAAEFFAKHHIPVWIDYHVGIAHNKEMILDEARVITGSVNFTRAAQMRNAENLLIIDDGNLAKKYLNNWQRRQDVSEVYAFVPEEKITVPPAVKHMDFFEWSRQMIKWFSAAF